MELNGARLVKTELSFDDKRCRALLLELPNACVLFLSEGELALGTLAIGMPITGPQVGERIPSSACVLGQRYSTLARALAERLALMSGKVALVSLRAEGPEAEVAARAMALLKEVMEGGEREP
ncbi:MAG TPA: hypothetical protein ENF78_01660 [Candidatus Bathyarchaeota archaeon]|nr:hypothetical protein [Candidatus Bathyarchaeota archaeon]